MEELGYRALSLKVYLIVSFVVFLQPVYQPQSDRLLPTMLHAMFNFFTHRLRSDGGASEPDFFKISTLEKVRQNKNKSFFKLVQDISSQQQKKNQL